MTILGDGWQDNKKYYFALGLVVFFAIVVRIVFSTGFYLTADDHFYSKAAHEISEGHFNLPNNHWNARIGNTISIAAFYKAFGVGEYAATFSSMLYSILTIGVICLLCKELFPRGIYKYVALLASIFYAFLPISIAEGSSLSMHQGVTFFMFLSLYFMLVGERTKSPGWYLLSGLVVGASYLFHETGAYVFILMFLFYLVKKRFDWKPLLIFGGFLLVVAVETASYYEITGEMFYRQNISLNPLETQLKNRVENDMSILDKLNTLKAINNPLSGTFVGDSWFLEPFRWSFLDPSNSILYYFVAVLSVMLLLRGDKKLQLLLIMFSGLYLYYAYGSPNPFSYEPLRRLPRYTLPCAVLGAIIAGYGLCKIQKQSAVILASIFLYILVSVFSISIKGGEIGQKIYQSKNFYQYIAEHPDGSYFTDGNTLNGIEFLSGYRNDYNVRAVGGRKFASYLKSADFLPEGGVLMLNVPENYSAKLAGLDNERFRLIQKYERKPRKICSIGVVREKLSESLCDISNGGRIYQVLPIS